MKHAAKEIIRELSQERLQTRWFLQYAIEKWKKHALATSSAVIINFSWESDKFNEVSLLRDHWLQRAAEKENDAVIRKLLTANVDVNVASADSYDGQTTLQTIAEEEHLEVMKRLLTANVDVNVVAAANRDDRTTLQTIAEHKTIMKILQAAAEL